MSIEKLKPIWLDLELREDIDDYFVLLYALDKKIKIVQLSIHNPSHLELVLANYLKKKYNQKFPIVITGHITRYKSNKDIHPLLKKKIINEKFQLEDFTTELLNNLQESVIFCGGSLTSLSNYLKIPGNKLSEIVIQGGYAGKSVVGDQNVLPKFREREKVPTWNLNLDVKASDYVLKNKKCPISLISKNVCHGSMIKSEELQSNTLFSREIEEYLTYAGRPKCFHDLLAFLSIFNEKLVQFKKVSMHHTDDLCPGWYSEINPDSNCSISIRYNHQLYLDFING